MPHEPLHSVNADGRGPAALLTGLMVLVAVTALLPRRGRGIQRLAADASVGAMSFDRSLDGREMRAGPARPLQLRASTRARRLRRFSRRAVVAVGSAGVIGALLGARVLVSAVAMGVVLGMVAGMRARQRRRRAAAARRGQVIEACGVLAADLRAGRTPQDALQGAATVCRDLQVAAAAARLGGDVGAALDLAAGSPGAAGLRALGAAWRVADRSGSAFATIVERLADSLRADEAVRRQVSAGLAGTRSTARLLAGLPLFGTVLGYGIGADPVAFLTGTPIGWTCLLLGLTLAVLGLAWVERLAESCEAGR